MNLEFASEPKYIKIDFKNKLILKNDSDIKEETSELEIISKLFQKEVPLEQINSFIDKILDKNTNDTFKYNKDYIKQYKKEFPFTEQDLSESVKRVLSSNYYPNFAFNKTNIEDISRILCFSYKSLKKYGINTEEKLKKKLENISLEEKDLINMYLDFDLIKSDKWDKTLEKRRKYRSKLYANKNPKSFNSTGNLATVKELCNEENIIENNKDIMTTKNSKTNDNINSSGSDGDNISEGVKKFFTKIKGIFDPSKKDKKKEKEKSNNTGINDIDDIKNEGKPISIYKDYFIYPEKNNSIKIKNELPIELVILIKKMEDVKILTFQIKGMTKKMVKENIIILNNINLLFPKFSEIKIDLNDDKLSTKLNKIYEIRQEELLKLYKLNYRILKYKKNYQSRTTNCWVPEGDILFENELNNEKENDININKKNYKLEENVFENSNNYENKLNSVDEENYPNIKYIIQSGQNKYSLVKKEFKEIVELDEEEEIMSRQSVNSELNLSPSKRTNIINPPSRITTSKLQEKSNLSQTFEITYIEQSTRKTTPHLLLSFVRKKKEPFEMILLYSLFLQKLTNIKILSLYFNDGFSLETEFYLKNEDITFEKFNFLLFTKKLKELNEINISFNSIDSGSFKKILGLINSNENISILRINFFPPNINFDATGLLKLCSLMKFSLHHLYREQRITFRKEREIKDLEMDYFLLNHKFDIDFEKNISSLFNIIKNNINKYKEIIFRFDLPLLLITCDKYIIIIIKFIINIISLINRSHNQINIFKIISPELILDGRNTPFLKYLFKNIGNNKNSNLTEFLLKCKIYRIPELFNFCLFNNINNIKIISIGDMDFETFSGFINLYNKNIDKIINLKILKIGLNNSIISYDDKISEKVNEYINNNPINLEQKILYSFIEMNHDFNKLENLIKNVQRSKINKLIIQIGKNNLSLLNKFYEKQKKELELLNLIMCKDNYKALIKEKIVKSIKNFFSFKNKEKAVICKPFFSSNEFY